MSVAMGSVVRPPVRPAPTPTLVADSLDFRRLNIQCLLGVLAGLVLPSLGPLTQPILVVAFLTLGGIAFMAVARRQFLRCWLAVVFLCVIEPGMRVYASVLPYLALDYLLLAIGILAFALSPRRRNATWFPVIAYGTYIVLEVTGSVFAPDLESARGIVMPSLLMFVFVLNSARLRLSPTTTTQMLATYIVGATTLTGFALHAYATGHITWTTESNLSASGGMPPNHITVLLSVSVFACVVLAEGLKRNRLQRLAILALATVQGIFMVLTFSRGGPVILVVCSFLYFVVLRPTNRQTIAAVVIVALAGTLVAYVTREITGDKIVERYGKVNTSNRYTIVAEGWNIYLDNPVMGVGTSNFAEAISETDFGRGSGAHNEMIRAAAEHGTLGLITWACFLVGSFAVVLRRDRERDRGRRALRIVILIFAFSSMFYNGLKLTVQPMLILVALTAFTVHDAAPKPRAKP